MSHLFLTGFMGTGKSAVGPRVAAALQYAYVDLDQTIEKAEGMSISTLFADHGEAHFRARETEMLLQIPDTPSTVVATGGGAVLAAANREWMAGHGHVVCLTAAPAEIHQRTRRRKDNRPLLDQPGDALLHITTLLAERAPLYQQCHHLIDTTARPVQQVVDEVVALHREGAWKS